MPNEKPNAKQFETNDQKIEEPNSYLETQKQHKDWFDQNQMGRQGGKPRIAPKEIKKAKGTHKHSLRKES